MIPQNELKTKQIPGLNADKTNCPPATLRGNSSTNVGQVDAAHERIITALQDAGFDLIRQGQYARLIVFRGAA